MGKEGKRWCVTPLEAEPAGLLMGWTREKMERGSHVIASAISRLVGAPMETTQTIYFVLTNLWVSGGGVKENQCC